MTKGDLYLKNSPLFVLRFFLGMGVLCFLLPWFALQSVTCDRTTPTAGQCQVRQTVLGFPIKTVPLTRLKGADVRSNFSGRSISHRVVLQMNQRADDIELWPISDSELSETTAGKIESFIHNPQQTHLKVTVDDRAIGFKLGVGFALLGPIVAILVARAESSY